MKYLIAGLGNIGAEYEYTRHNVGFMVLDKLSATHHAPFRTARLGDLATYKHRGRTLYLLKPNTYMNLSGKAIRYWLNQYKIPLERSLVVVDDIALPLGKLRLRPQGSSAGHNGLKSIEQSLATQAYPRLRIGIGNDFPQGRQADYVLAPFTTEEQKPLSASIDRASQAVMHFCTLGIVRTMAQCNAHAVSDS